MWKPIWPSPMKPISISTPPCALLLRSAPIYHEAEAPGGGGPPRRGKPLEMPVRCAHHQRRPRPKMHGSPRDCSLTRGKQPPAERGNGECRGRLTRRTCQGSTCSTTSSERTQPRSRVRGAAEQAHGFQCLLL